tara:strand:- start:3340 stop:3633 length:294 start_codon:yes stop_codon:yes gene_type:complete
MLKNVATMIALMFAIGNTAMADVEFNPATRLAEAEAATGLQLYHRAPPPRPPPHRRPPPRAAPSVATVIIVCATIIVLASIDDQTRPSPNPQARRNN